MRTVEQWLEEYGESHRNALNKTLHWICVPIIVVSLIGLLWSLPTPAAWREISPLLNWGSLIPALLIAIAIGWLAAHRRRAVAA